jgi:hypothetical protein
MATTFEVKGLKETLEVFEQLRIDIGNKNATSKILVPAVKEAMKPVLAMAQAPAPVDTGLLEHSLDIVGRKPTNSDRKSRYVTALDDAIAIVTTKPIPKKLKGEMWNAIGHLWNPAKGADNSKYRAAKRKFFESQGSFYDARAIANEFGTVNRQAKPFLRISLESQSQTVAEGLGRILKQKIEQYRSKYL